MSVLSDVSTLVAPFTALLGGLGGFWLAGRNDEARDRRTSEREEDARRATRTERLDDQQHEIQRATLMELQDELTELARLTNQVLMFDRAHPGGRAAGLALPDQLETAYLNKLAPVNRLMTRVLDRQLRGAIGTYVGTCARDVSIPRSGGLSEDELILANMQQLAEINNLFARVNDLLGEHIRDELDMLGTGQTRLAQQAIEEAIAGGAYNPQ